MRGAVLAKTGDALEIRDDLTPRAAGPGEVRVRLRASGVCHSDLSIRNGTLGTAALPVVLGHEGAGEIVEVGPEVSGLSVGQHVILAWVPPCGGCALCLGGQPYLCTSGRVVGRAAFDSSGQDVYAALGVGTFAEETVVPAIAAIPIPDDVPFEVAALVGCGVMTGVGAALNTARVRPGASVCVIGCGGVGINVVQGARAAGAGTILAVDRVAGRRSDAIRFGATDACSDSELGLETARLTDGAGFDYAFEVVGRGATIRLAWDATRRGGTTVVVGAGSAQDSVSFTAGELFSTGRTLLGCLYGSADVRTDFARVLRMWRAGRLDLAGLVTRTITLDQVNDAFTAMENGEVLRSVIRY